MGSQIKASVNLRLGLLISTWLVYRVIAIIIIGVLHIYGIMECFEFNITCRLYCVSKIPMRPFYCSVMSNKAVLFL